MRFTVLDVGVRPDRHESEQCFLLMDNWNDYWDFQTLYHLTYRDARGRLHVVGEVKIGSYELVDRRPPLPADFESLSDQFFSVGQDDTYYSNLGSLGGVVKDEVLQALNDMAFDDQILEAAIDEEVTGTSLFRSVSPTTVRGQFRRLATTGDRLKAYNFTYVSRKWRDANVVTLNFDVHPSALPPSNIHVLIGRNGVGKTTMLNNMAHAALEPDADPDEYGQFAQHPGPDDFFPFTNLISVTFSAFDPFRAPVREERPNRARQMDYTYVGLKRPAGEGGIRSDDELAELFEESFQLCQRGARRARWRRALQMLSSDPIFDTYGSRLLSAASSGERGVNRAIELFSLLSSGHKIVLLTITRLVESVDEGSLVLLDEPEAHLHPPLLSALIRTLSDLLMARNGVAVIATHSPVVLQEVPSSCVYVLRRSGYDVIAERPSVESFGEAVGVLTREVFGLEVTSSGFHRLLSDRIAAGASYDDLLEAFGGELGLEARSLARGLLQQRSLERF
jgi:ABC-type transport system involved in cytochrome c biogenesis ATPase subunit